MGQPMRQQEQALPTSVSLRSWQLPLQALGDDSEVAILLVPSSSSSLPPPGEAVLELHHTGETLLAGVCGPPPPYGW